MAVTAPSGLSATSQSATSIYLAWTNHYEPYSGYARILIQYSTDGSTWSQLRTLGGLAANYTHNSATSDTTYYYRVYGKHPIDLVWIGPSNEDTALCATSSESDTVTTSDSVSDSIYTPSTGDTIIDYVTCSDSVTSAVNAVSTITDTVTTSDSISSAQTIQTNHAYYLGSSNGVIYLHSSDYQGDAGNTVTSIWQGKDADFSDQFPDMTDQWKTVWGAKLYYEDLEQIEVTVSLSNDGGITYVSQQQTLGSGTEKVKSATFFFHLTGQKITPKITHGSSANKFKWLGLEIEFEPAGEHWGAA